jgi:DNA-binding NtrC family response regulator
MTTDRRRVLVVEDEAAVRESVARVLAAEGIEVDFAEDLQTALDHPRRPTCGAVLCDLKLPDGTALDLLKAVRAERPELPFIVTTGFATRDTLTEARAAGANDILLKPFDATELVDMVSSALAASAPKEEKP